MFVLKVNKSSIRVLETEPIYGDSKNIYNVVLLFNEDWTGLSKIITFDNGKESKPILVSDPTRTIVTTSIPWELLTYPGTIRISIAGAKNNLVVLPTQFCVLGKVKQGSTTIYPPDTPNPPPTPTIVDQLIGLIAEKGDTLKYENDILYLMSGETILSEVEIQNGTSANVPYLSDVTIDNKSFFDDDIDQTYYFHNVTVSYNPPTVETRSLTPPEEPPAEEPGTKLTMMFYEDVVQVISTSESFKIYTIDGEIITFLYGEDGSLSFGSSESAGTGADGKSAYEIAVEKGFEGTEEEWLASLNGKSAYDIAVENGFNGTEEEWINSLNSAYEIAVANGFEGTVTEWLESLKGADGKSAYDIAVENGFEGTEQEWLESIKGDDGKSAYDIAVENGFEGSEQEWLTSLEGKSAYGIAVENGFTGTEEEWIASLEGKSAYEIAVENGFTGTEEEWVNSIKGEAGVTPTIGENGNWFIGDTDTGVSASGGNVDLSNYVTNEELSEKQPLDVIKSETGGLTPTDISTLESTDPTSAILNGNFELTDGSVKTYTNEVVTVSKTLSDDGSTSVTVGSNSGKVVYKWIPEANKWEIESSDNYLSNADIPTKTSDLINDSGFIQNGNGLRVLSEDPTKVIEPEQITENGSYILTGKFTDSLSYDSDSVSITKETSESGDISLTIRDSGGSSKLVWDPVSKAWTETDRQEILYSGDATGTNGKSAYEIAVENGFTGSETEWLASLNGKSAYEIAVEKGFEGSETEWLASLKGADGQSAYDIAVENGFEGTEQDWIASLNGKSAYEIAVENGFEGTEQDWLTSLKGTNGKSAYEIAVENGYTGNVEEWTTSLNGKSAYEIAVKNGFSGSETEWLASLKGESGKSAYETAVENGFEGTETEWLASLKGSDGKSAYEIAVENGFEGTEQEWLQSITMDGIKISVVDALPKIGEDRILYFVPKVDAESNNYYEEWMWINSKWELIGTTKIDLSNYVTKPQLEASLSETIPTKVSELDNDAGFVTAYTPGPGISISGKTISNASRIVTLSLAEYEALSEEEKNLEDVYYNIIDSSDSFKPGTSTGINYTAGDGIKIQADVISVTTPVRGPMTQTEFDALPVEQQNRGLYIIID